MSNLVVRRMEGHIRSIPTDIILTFFTGGLYNLWIQKRQIDAVNDMLGEDKYGWASWFILTIFTFGLYHIYHEYKKSVDIGRVIDYQDTMSPALVMVLSFFGLSFLADAIQQGEINEYFDRRIDEEKKKLLYARADAEARSDLYVS